MAWQRMVISKCVHASSLFIGYVIQLLQHHSMGRNKLAVIGSGEKGVNLKNSWKETFFSLFVFFERAQL